MESYKALIHEVTKLKLKEINHDLIDELKLAIKELTDLLNKIGTTVLANVPNPLSPDSPEIKGLLSNLKQKYTTFEKLTAPIIENDNYEFDNKIIARLKNTIQIILKDLDRKLSTLRTMVKNSDSLSPDIRQSYIATENQMIFLDLVTDEKIRARTIQREVKTLMDFTELDENGKLSSIDKLQLQQSILRIGEHIKTHSADSYRVPRQYEEKKPAPPPPLTFEKEAVSPLASPKQSGFTKFFNHETPQEIKPPVMIDVIKWRKAIAQLLSTSKDMITESHHASEDEEEFCDSFEILCAEWHLKKEKINNPEELKSLYHQIATTIAALADFHYLAQETLKVINAIDITPLPIEIKNLKELVNTYYACIHYSETTDEKSHEARTSYQKLYTDLRQLYDMMTTLYHDTPSEKRPGLHQKINPAHQNLMAIKNDLELILDNKILLTRYKEYNAVAPVEFKK
jgi:Skp family chaperone for outer membrane proteins